MHQVISLISFVGSIVCFGLCIKALRQLYNQSRSVIPAKIIHNKRK